MDLYISDCEDGYSLLRKREDGKFYTSYSCRYIVAINIYEKGGPPFVECEEWKGNIERYEVYEQYRFDKPEQTKYYGILHESCDWNNKLQFQTLKWLNENIKMSTDKNRSDYPWGWDYKHQDGTSVDIFFLRKRDALNFIKEFSDLGKPENIYDKRDI